MGMMERYNCTDWLGAEVSSIGSVSNRPQVMQLLGTQQFCSLTISQRAAISKCLTNAEVIEWFRRTETKRRPEQVEKKEQPENWSADLDGKRSFSIGGQLQDFERHRSNAMQVVLHQNFNSLVTTQRADVNMFLTNAEVVQWFRQSKNRTN